MFSSITRSFAFLARTPLVPPTPTGPAMVELTTMTRAAPAAAAAGPSRPRAYSRSFSNMSVKSGYNAQESGAVAARPAMAKRPSASRMDSRMSGFGMSPIAESRRWASDKGKKELYSDESGAIGAGIDDVAHSDAAFNKETNPESAAKQVEQETGKDFTKHSPANEDYSKPIGEHGGKGTESSNPVNTSKKNK